MKNDLSFIKNNTNQLLYRGMIFRFQSHISLIVSNAIYHFSISIFFSQIAQKSSTHL